MADIKAALDEIRQPHLANVPVGNAFDSLRRAGSRNRDHNPGEFVLMTRAFVVVPESMRGQLAPDHDCMESFRVEIARLIAQYFSRARIEETTTEPAHETERLLSDAHDDTRRVLRGLTDGAGGRLPGLEALGNRFSRNNERLASSIAFAALVLSGAMRAADAAGQLAS